MGGFAESAAPAHPLAPNERDRHALLQVGWREWVALPEFNIRAIKAKIDTGARTSALHAFSVERFFERGRPRVRFQVHPWRMRTDIVVSCETDIIDERVVTDSGGHSEKRVVIATDIIIADRRETIEITIADRDTMRYRMLLGRTAIRNRMTVDPSYSYRLGRPQLPKPNPI
ncbi:MAG: RimK/LysX family protein [Gammaproteobacteria bacterium]